jgi:hypothetical protein
MDEYTQCKVRSGNVVSLLSMAANKEIGNETIAKLNDLAYQGVRNKGLLKVIETRAIEN